MLGGLPCQWFKVDCGVQRTERADNCEDCEPQNDLGDTVARKLTKRFVLRVTRRRYGKLGRQPKPVNRSERQHGREGNEFEHQQLSIFGDKQRVK